MLLFYFILKLFGINYNGILLETVWMKNWPVKIFKFGCTCDIDYNKSNLLRILYSL